MNVKEYEMLVKAGEKKDRGFVVKLEIVSHMIGFDSYKKLNDDSRNKLLDYLYLYWWQLDSLEHTCYGYVEAIFSSVQYIGIDIVSMIDSIDYDTFVNLIEEKALL